MDIGIGNAQTLGSARMASSPVAATPVLGAAAAKPEEGEREASAVSIGAKAGETNGEQIEEAVTSIQNFVQTIRRDLNFSLDDSSGRVVVKVTDSASGEVIRQLPSEEALRLAESLEEVRSLLFKAEA